MRAGLVAHFVQIEIGRSLLPDNFLEVGHEFPAIRVNARPDITGCIPEHCVDRVHPVAYRRVAAWDIQLQPELALCPKKDTDEIVVGPGRGRPRTSCGVGIERDRERSAVGFPINMGTRTILFLIAIA